MFSAAKILASCQVATESIAIEIVEKTGSTNADLMARVSQEFSPTLLIAETQTAGRGRAGRTWLSDTGSLTFSLAWKFDIPIQKLAGLPLAVGVALAEALSGFNVYVQLKWPNDVLKNGKKLAGILIETVAGSSKHDPVWAIIGVGLNLTVSGGLEDRIGQEVADAPWLAQLDRNILMAALLDSLTSALERFEKNGFAAFTMRWNKLHAYAGLSVMVLDRGELLHEGQAAGVDTDGRLLIDTDSGRVALLAGDISLRLT